MRLSELIERDLRRYNITVVNNWESRGTTGVALGNPNRTFPYHGPQYLIDTTERGADPELTQEEVKAIKRRFNLDRIGEIL